MLNPLQAEMGQNLFNSIGFIPHGHCYLWKPELVALHVLSDGLIALAYYCIALTLLYFVRQRQDLPFRGIFLLFSAFILACGTTHWMEIWTLWHPSYWLSGTIKAATALVSTITAVQLVPVLPLALSLRSSQELERLNQELEREVKVRQQTEATLRESEARSRSAFDHAAIGMALVSLEGRWLKVNRALVDLVGYSETELLNRCFQDITHPHDLADCLNCVRQLAAGTTPIYQLEKRYLHQAGHTVWVSLNASVVRDATDQPLYFIAQVQNIDARKQAEERLRQSEARYRAIVEDQTDLICRFQSDGTVLYVNDAYCRYFGVNPTQILGNSYQPVVYEADLEAVALQVQSMSWEKPTITIENRVVAHGFVRWTQWNNRLIFDQDKQLVEYQAVGRDITRLKQIEADLRQSEQRYHTLIDTIPQLVWVAAADGITAIDRNQQWVNFTGQTPQEAEAQGWLKTLHPDDVAITLERWAEAVTTGTDYEVEQRLRRKDGEYIWHLAKAKPTRDEQGQLNYWYGTCTDISEAKRDEVVRNQAEELREQQMQELQRLNELKDDFLSTVSHELRAPLANIMMGTQMLKLILEQSEVSPASIPKAHRYLKIVRDEAQRELSLLNDLLDLSRLQAGADPRLATEIELQIWIPHVAEPFEERIREQGQALEISLAEALPSLVTDVSYLKRILTELLHNACKYTPLGETIAIEVCTIDPMAAAFQLRVNSSGIEIPPTEHDRIFDKFYRIPNTDPWKHGGTGLGLALVKQMVEHLGGTIWVETADSQTSFVVQLPSLRQGG